MTKAFFCSLRKHLRPVKRIFNWLSIRLAELPYKFKKPERGSVGWLIKTEVKYGGFISDVPRRKVSPLDARTAEALNQGGMIGGDRMLHHKYAPTYAQFLKPFLNQNKLRCAEFGILKGTGLAIWCDLFPDARVIGFDIDPAYFEANRENLRKLGAFSENSPEIYFYDQLVDGRDILAKVFDQETLDVVIDDGLHSLEAIIKTWRTVRPFLSQRFVYFVEDYPGLLEQSGTEFASFECKELGMMTVIYSGIAFSDMCPRHG